MDKVRFGIIGIGNMGSGHAQYLYAGDIEGACLAAVCDLKQSRLDWAKEKFGDDVARFTDYKEMYDAVEPDMVFICIPPDCHGEIEFETIRRGIPFFVEKPLALELSLAREIRDAAEAKGLITASGFQCRYSNIVEPTREFLRTDKRLSGGQVVEQTIHQFDMIRYVFGEPDTVFSMATRGFVDGGEGYRTDDLSSTVVRFRNGALGVISTGCYATGGECFDSKITFSATDARLDHYIIDKVNIYGEQAAPAESSGQGLVVRNDGTMKAAGSGAQVIRDDGSAGVICDRTFIDAVLTGDGSKIRSSYRDALRSVAFTLACNQSMETGLPVKVELD